MSSKNKPQVKPQIKQQVHAGRDLNPDQRNASPKQKKIFILIILLYSVFLYLNTANHEYAFDDAVAITGNKFIEKGMSGIPDLFTHDFFAGIYDSALELPGGRYRPLSLVTFAIERQFSANPTTSHIINILLYALTAVILLLTLEEMFPGRFMFCATATLLFIAHPLHTEVVANVKSRDEILSFMGLCLALLYLFRWVKSNNKKYLVFSLVAYFLSLLSKENGITFLAIIPLTLYCFAGQDLKKSMATTLPYFITGVAFVLIRAHFVGFIGDRENTDIMENPFTGTGFSERMATITVILGKYLGLLFYPHPLSSDYSFNQIPIVGWNNGKALLSLLIHVALGVYAIRELKNKSIVAYGILFYFITMSLVSNIVFNIGAPMGERFAFLPSLGFCLAITAVYLKWIKKENSNNLKVPLMAFLPFIVVLLGFSFKTITRNKDWKNNETLFGADVVSVPNSAKAQYYYANTLLNYALSGKDDPEKPNWLKTALPHAKRATEINPKFHHAFYCLGQIYQEMNIPDSAITAFNHVLELQPTHILTQSALGTVYGKQKGDFKNAIHYLTLAVKYNPKDGGAFENLGIAYAMKGVFDSSLVAFNRALELKPESPQSYLNVAITYQNMRDSVNANIYFEKAFKLDPSLRKVK